MFVLLARTKKRKRKETCVCTGVYVCNWDGGGGREEVTRCEDVWSYPQSL